MNIHRIVGSLLAVSIAAFPLAGCITDRVPESATPPVQAIQASSKPLDYPASAEAPKTADGSLFHQQTAGWSPWQDATASTVGDIVTVQVSVNNTAENKATTSSSRESHLEAGITSLFGLESQLPGVNSTNPLNATTPGQLIKTDSTSTFDGAGDTTRSGKLVADVSALVTHVYPNGNMRIQGSQSLLINNENSLITVDGIIRPGDVSFDNAISSDRIANARIELTGRGVVSDKQRPGVLMRAFDWVWPF
jgi:flagellar L-ring protein precursor FlgH